MPQEELSHNQGTITRQKTAEPRKYKVYVLNDDFTTFEFVIEVMMYVFFKSMSEAEQIAQQTHFNGKSLVGVYSYDIARSKVDKAVSLARAENFPLRFEVTPQTDEENTQKNNK